MGGRSAMQPSGFHVPPTMQRVGRPSTAQYAACRSLQSAICRGTYAVGRSPTTSSAGSLGRHLSPGLAFARSDSWACLTPHELTSEPSQSSDVWGRSRALRRVAQVVVLAAVVITVGLASSASAAASSPTASSSGTGILDFALHLDKHLKGIIDRHGTATYAILFTIVFAETGFVLTPFLPGDSLLFAAGAFCASGALQLGAVMSTFITAAILGDAVNYTIGHSIGEKALSSRLIKGEFIAKTNKFYAKYGGKTIVLARFVPIIRTFAPFVAGVGAMHYPRFLAFNVAGALIWTVLFTGAGYYFGNLPFVKENFTLVVLAIVAVSVLPVAFELWNSRRHPEQMQAGPESGAARTEPNFAWIYPKSRTPERSPNLDWLM